MACINIPGNSFILLFFLAITMASCAEYQSSGKGQAEMEKHNVEDPTYLQELYRYYHSDPKTQHQLDENRIIDFLIKHQLKAERYESGLYIVKHAEGPGHGYQWGQEVHVHYKGYFPDGTVFDQKYAKDRVYNFTIGNMIAGWNEAMTYLKKGDQVTLLIPSRLAYASAGFGGIIPPDQVLIFDVQILK